MMGVGGDVGVFERSEGVCGGWVWGIGWDE